jgi:hypothetical protein
LDIGNETPKRRAIRGFPFEVLSVPVTWALFIIYHHVSHAVFVGIPPQNAYLRGEHLSSVDAAVLHDFLRRAFGVSVGRTVFWAKIGAKS